MIDHGGPRELDPERHLADQGFGLYVHWPFCRAKCPYCDFNSHVAHGFEDARWARALLSELDHFAALTPGRALGSIFFGGGTPSLMAPETVAAVIDRAASRWQLSSDVEITLEANPSSVEAKRFRGYRSAGVNRVSLGVQALDDRALAWLGRTHNVTEALAAVDLAAKLFPRYSFDLIYALPGQSASDWRGTLRKALSHAGDHLSLYQLTIEPGTRFHALAARGQLVPLPEEDQATLYALSQELLTEAGLPAYEVSNHARPGAESRHNLVYWRCGDYVGIGPGAHGRVTNAGDRLATCTLRDPARWLAAVESRGHGEETRETIDPEAQLVELLMMGLRLSEGVRVARIERLSGRPLRCTLDRSGLERAHTAGWLSEDYGRLRATAAGRQRLDGLLRLLL